MGSPRGKEEKEGRRRPEEEAEWSPQRQRANK